MRTPRIHAVEGMRPVRRETAAVESVTSDAPPMHWSQVLAIEQLTLPAGFKALADLLPAGIFSTDADGGYIYANGSWSALTGLDAAAARGEGWFDAVHPDDRDQVRFEWRTCVVTRQPFHLDYRLQRATGDVLWVTARAVPDTSASSAGGYVGTITDITDLKVYAGALKDSKTRFERALRAINAGIWEWDFRADKAFYSDRFKALLGFDDDASGFATHFDFREVLHPEDRDRVLAAVDRALADQSLFDEEYRLRRRGGDYRWYRGYGVGHRDEQESTVRFTGSLTDIGRRKAAELALQRSHAQLEQRVAERTRQLAKANGELEAFAYTVAHDLRAPLRSVQGFVGRFVEANGEALDAGGRELLDRAARNACHMSQMIEELLRFSLLMRQDMKSQAVDMTELARSVADDLVQLHGTRPRVEIAPLPPARGDLLLLRQVWANLLGNALKFSAPAPEPRIEIDAELRTGYAVYRIRDNGVGFDSAHASKLFDVFTRLHDEREFEGTGVGLATVKRIVERHGGEVWATGNPGAGAVFCFSLPLRPIFGGANAS